MLNFQASALKTCTKLYMDIPRKIQNNREKSHPCFLPPAIKMPLFNPGGSRKFSRTFPLRRIRAADVCGGCKLSGVPRYPHVHIHTEKLTAAGFVGREAGAKENGKRDGLKGTYGGEREGERERERVWS